ncbi:unknown [Alistipes sp. CAG:831]|nr:unknown [Alistipes sp. CAG:831]
MINEAIIPIRRILLNNNLSILELAKQRHLTFFVNIWERQGTVNIIELISRCYRRHAIWHIANYNNGFRFVKFNRKPTCGLAFKKLSNFAKFIVTIRNPLAY